ncbi:MAG TPA: hypothetical protein VGE07_17690 [Herpetosiphonaceae bacterium]
MLRFAPRLSSLLVCLVLAACGGPAKGTVIPLPPGTVQPQSLPNLGDLLSGTPRPTPVPLDPALPPGNGRLFYIDRELNRGVMMVPAEGGEPQVIGRFREGERVGLVRSWSPDHQSALISAGDSGPGSSVDAEHFYVTDAYGANPRYLGVIDAACQSVSDPVWAPDGTKAIVAVMVFAAEHTSSCDMTTPSGKALYLLDLKALAVRKLAEDPDIYTYSMETKIAWSPDSSTIAYATGEVGHDELPDELRTLRLADPRPETRLRDIEISRVFWPAPGEVLLEASCDGSPLTHLCVFDPASGAVEPAFRTEDDAALIFDSLSPDGTWLLARELRRDLLLLINRRTGAAETIPDSADLYTRMVVWSPNGRYLAIPGAGGRSYAYEIGSGRPVFPLISAEVWAWLP